MKYPNATEEVMKANMTHGFRAKYTFGTEDEAKRFFNKVKTEMGKFPEFLRPKT